MEGEKQRNKSFLPTQRGFSQLQTRAVDSLYSLDGSHPPSSYFPPEFVNPSVLSTTMNCPPSIQQVPPMGNNYHAYGTPSMHSSPLHPPSPPAVDSPPKERITNAMLDSMLELILPTTLGTPRNGENIEECDIQNEEDEKDAPQPPSPQEISDAETILEDYSRETCEQQPNVTTFLEEAVVPEFSLSVDGAINHYKELNPEEMEWMESLEKLKLYKREFGDCQVPPSYDSQLAEWIEGQRRQYKLLMDGKESSITPARVQLLNDLGFSLNEPEAAGHLQVPEPVAHPQEHCHDTPNDPELPQSEPKSEQSIREARWLERFHELKEFKREMGHCNVPMKYSKNLRLGKWVCRQRNLLRRLKEGKGTFTGLTKERVDMLDSVCFVWEPKSKQSKNEAKWMEKIHELKEFKKETGHCNVPYIYPKNPKLGQWVQRQRDYLRKAHNDEPTPLTKKRIDMLHAVGFVLDARRDASNAKWLELFRELKEFKSEWGHCCVPDKYPRNPRLVNWAQLQRGDLRRLNKGEPPLTYLNQDRIDMLDSVGFVWEPKLFSDESAWPERFRELKEFKMEMGHCNVPEKYSKNLRLGHWVCNQKLQLRRLYNGEPTNLTKDRIDMLNAIGFVWQA